MKEETKKLLLIQGFSENDIQNDPTICSKARWTPFSCASVGTAGLLLGNSSIMVMVCPCAITGFFGLLIGKSLFFMILGLLTLTGGYSVRSVYDRFYNFTFRYILHTSVIPRHGAQRQFGCAIGGIMYFLTGIGFYLNNLWLAYAPALFMIVFALIAGITQWCFASSLYNYFNKRKINLSNYTGN